MGNLLVGFLLPLLLLAAGLLNWSLISFIDLVISLLLRIISPKRGFQFRGRVPFLWCIIIYSVLVVILQVIFLVRCGISGPRCSIEDSWWMELFGLMKLQAWRSPTSIIFMVIQLLAGVVAFLEVNRNSFGLTDSGNSVWRRNISSVIERIGYRLRLASCFLLPLVQLVVGISKPSWLSFPFFVCSCVGLVDWSLTSNFLGLFRWWKMLWVYSGSYICLLYVYQLPLGFQHKFKEIADSIGLYQESADSDWEEICSGISLVAFYYMLSFAKRDLEDTEFIMSMRQGSLTERLLPSKNSFFVRQLRSGVRHTNILLRGNVFRFFSINWFTYGFPISLLALSYWSIHFSSICSFGLLAYVGYILYACPSLFRMHHLNGLLLIFILLWAASTYIFNVTFTYVNWKLAKDMEIWEMVGLWHYPIPGFFLLAQFCLGIVVALGNLVNNSVFLCVSDEERQFSNGDTSEEVKEDTIVLIVATVAWLLRKCCRPILLVLIFLIAMKPGFIHAAYLIFFFIFLLSNDVSTKLRQALVLLCEAHFAILYILELDLVATKLTEKGSISLAVLSQLGLLEGQSSWDFLEITILACVCAIYNHGFEMLFSFSAVVEHAPYHPIGFSILRAGLNKSVLLTVYAASDSRDHCHNNSNERRIASYLSAIGEQFSSLYRSFGTYVAFLTILFAVYFTRPNYVSFGYTFLLLVWIIGRQLVEMTKQRLWCPLKLYATAVFIFNYILSVFPAFEVWISEKVDLYACFGYKIDALLLENLWDSLAIMIVMQLYSYERRQSKHDVEVDDGTKPLQLGILGFLQRFLIWHSEKILFAALFYASLSPISAFGFLYLLGLIFCSLMPKTSKIPSKSFLIYTGFLVSAEYLFQMWGKLLQMFPGQKHHDLSLFLGLQVYKQSFGGREAGLRAKVLVITVCTLQYNVFHWLEKMPNFVKEKGGLQEPCPLFISTGDLPINFVTPSNENKKTISECGESPAEKVGSSKPSPSVSICGSRSSQDFAATTEGANNGSVRRNLLKIWGSMKESHNWDKKTIHALKQERFEMQMTTLKVYLKFWMENMFNLFGLEINMIALLFASFALLNAISIFYIACLATCVLLACTTIRKLWPVFVFVQAVILLAEYFAMWKHVMASLGLRASDDTNVHCHECWKISSSYFNFCTKCWLGIVVDDPRLLISYSVVFLLACFKLRADRATCFSASFAYNQMVSQHKNAFVWRDLSFETKSMWTFLDYLRVYCYCHLLDLVLALILITGTLEYDVLHLGYLGFALIFFRMRLTILKKKNRIFKYLRVYNFAVIVLSLAYQCPFVGDFSGGNCATIGYIYEVIGFHKYDYGFRITSRSALVEIIIFILVSCQSYMFSSSEFDYVFRYLEAEQIGAIVREQEKKAAWKTELLRHIREFEETKRQRNLQVEKIKSEMLNIRIQLHDMDSAGDDDNSALPPNDGLRRRTTSSLHGHENQNLEKQDRDNVPELSFPINTDESPKSLRPQSPFSVDSKKHAMDYSLGEIKELEEHRSDSSVQNLGKGHVKEHPLASAVQFIGDGVSQVQSIGNQAVGNIVSYFNIAPEDSDAEEHSTSGDELPKELRRADTKQVPSSFSLLSEKSSTGLQLRRIVRYIWSQIRSNNDFVCYCCFVFVFLWNFSFLSMVYLAGLYLYALCVNTGPNYIFWVIMLVYTECYILIQYLYQIMIQHCGFSIQSSVLLELGFPTKRIKSSFVVSLLPLFLVYLFTLIQSSITAKDGEWFSIGFNNVSGWSRNRRHVHAVSSWGEKAKDFFEFMKRWVQMVAISCCRYWKSLTQEAESPPYFVQVSMAVEEWPEDGIQPERIESVINHMLQLLHRESCKKEVPSECLCCSKVQIRSIEVSAEDGNVALAVFEVLYASSLTDCRGEEQLNSLTPAADVAKEILRAQSLGFVEEAGFPYKIVSVIGGGRREIDLYAYVFGADLTVFFLVAIFYQSVIKNKSEFLEYYQLEDQFPIEFVVILMIIFFLIVVDRIIYLCSFATGKVIFYLFNLILFTYAVTKYAWNLDTSKHKTAGMALRAIYLTKAVSLALQAVQIRFGVPHQSTLYRQFLTSKVTRVNYLGYRLYRALPFLYELRCVLDWSCTSTSLTMYDWLKLEDINASLYLVKCDNVLNREMHKPGEKQTRMTKFCNGIFLFFILILVIWAPMLMYSSGNPSNIANPINDVSFQLNIKTDAGRLTFYKTTLCERIDWSHIDSNADVDLDPNHYLDSYDAIDIQLICCQADASTLWLVPESVQKQFTGSLDTSATTDIKISWIFTRERPKGKEMVKYERNVDPWDLPKPSDVVAVLNGSSSSFRVRNIYPRIFRVTGSGDVRPFEQEVNDVSVQLVLHGESISKWWSLHDLNSSNAYGGCGGLSGPMAIVVSEETPQGFLGETLSKFSIWGLYITFVLAVGRFIRMQCSDLRMRIPYENLPSCDRLIAIWEDIYTARAEGELGVEEVLYWTLIKIYRSPHMLLEYTKQD